MPKSAKKYIKELQNFINTLGIGKIASISGRYYAMDRDHNWDRTDKTFNLLINGIGKKFPTPIKAIEYAYKAGISDEFIEPSLIEVGPGEEGTISSNDGVIFFNFRTDRPRQLTERFLTKGPKNLSYVTMTQYNPEYQVKVAFLPTQIHNVLGEVVARAKLKQLRITETEKFAHATFFFNGKREEAFEGEDRIILDSYSDIKTHDLRPEMRTPDIAKQVIQFIQSDSYELIITNLCNCDVVGHTGNLKATIEGVKVVDQAIYDIVSSAQENEYAVIITGDHGNAEEMIDEKTKEMLTAHTTNNTPFILIDSHYSKLLRHMGNLTNIAPTILKIMGLKKPAEMTGRSFV